PMNQYKDLVQKSLILRVILMKAILVCGGLGTRLRPHTYKTPKSMLPLGNRPIVGHLIELLRQNGVTEIYLTIGYLKEQFKEYFKDGSKFGVKIFYSEEDENLNTAGSTLPIKDRFTGTFLVMMGDHFTEIDLKKMLKFHREKGGIATVGLKSIETQIQYGVVELGGSRIKEFREKPKLLHYVNAGIYAFEPEIFDYIKEKEDYAKDVFPRLLKNKKQINGYIFDERWLDIGQAEDYEKAHKLFSKK
ncbi:MAG: nucleotidyltransferase family protein, partial [Candidatus Micrarchaeota archaeon]